MSSLQRDAKIYGAVESESYITFTGFCKKIYDTIQQSVDVFIDEKKVATLLANEKIADIEDKYEVFDTNGFCFTYHLPKEYIGQKHKLEFKTQEGEQLLHSPTHTIDKFSPLYNQAMFIESLNQSLQYDVIKDGYTKNALSFIAIEENLNDKDFVDFVLEMCKKHKELTLNIFYFNEHQKNQATKIFNQIKNKNFLNPSSIEEIIKNSEIYLHNAIEEFRFAINEEYYNKVKNQTAIQENLFILELTRKAKKKKDMSEMFVDSVTPILFETSIISQMFKADERYNEFIFMNSLYFVDEEKIKDMYCPNSIGVFIAKDFVEQSLDFILKIAHLNYDIQVKVFVTDKVCLDILSTTFKGIQNIELHIVTNVFTIFKNVEIFVIYSNSNNMNFISSILIPFKRMLNQLQNIYSLVYDEMAKNSSLGILDMNRKNAYTPYINDYKKLGLKRCFKESTFKTIYEEILQTDTKNIDFYNVTFEQYLIKLINKVSHDKKTKDIFINARNLALNNNNIG